LFAGDHRQAVAIARKQCDKWHLRRTSNIAFLRRSGCVPFRVDEKTGRLRARLDNWADLPGYRGTLSQAFS